MNAAVYVACRVEDLPVPYVDSEMRACERCSGEVWVDPVCFQSTMRDGAADPLLLCTGCASEVEQMQLTLTPEQADLIAEYLRRR